MINFFNQRLLLLALISSFSSPLIAADYYVDQSHPDANDTNPGSEVLPWETIQKAANTLTAGDRVLVKSGEYTELFAGYPKKAVKGIDTVFHLAALIAIPYSYDAPGAYISTNVSGTLNLLQAALDYKVEKKGCIISNTAGNTIVDCVLIKPINITYGLCQLFITNLIHRIECITQLKNP